MLIWNIVNGLEVTCLTDHDYQPPIYCNFLSEWLLYRNSSLNIAAIRSAFTNVPFTELQFLLLLKRFWTCTLYLDQSFFDHLGNNIFNRPASTQYSWVKLLAKTLFYYCKKVCFRICFPASTQYPRQVKPLSLPVQVPKWRQVLGAWSIAWKPWNIFSH